MLSIRWRCSFVVIFSDRLRGEAPAEVGGQSQERYIGAGA